MAFVSAPGALLRARGFTGAAVSQVTAPRAAASVRMAKELDSETAGSEFGTVGKSMWKEDPFTGGFPGGEAFLLSWTEDGMKKTVPDMPEKMQPSSAPGENPVQQKKGILGKLDATEFFKGFGGEGKAQPEEEEMKIPAPVSPKPATPVPQRMVEEPDVAPDAPNPALYQDYYPESIRSLAPDIKIEYENNPVKDRVGVAMTPVTASFTDLHFPKESKNKAPMIDISYAGNLGTASVKLSMEYVQGLPALPPPPKRGDAVTELKPGRGGGLKLEYSVAGEGSVNI